jgi:hypothetical protein
VNEWLPRWRQRLAQEPSDATARQAAMRAVNPAFIPRNHRVEAMIRAAVDRQDFSAFEELLSVLSRPYEDQPEFAHYATPPQENERVRATFCGTYLATRFRLPRGGRDREKVAFQLRAAMRRDAKHHPCCGDRVRRRLDPLPCNRAADRQ